MKRRSVKEIEGQIGAINVLLTHREVDLRLTLNCAYGGYRIANNNGNRDLSPRLDLAEMIQWLCGFASALCEA